MSTESFHSFLRHHPLIRYRPVHGTLLRQNKSTLGPEKNRQLSFLKCFFYQNWFLHMVSQNFYGKKNSCDRDFKAIPQYCSAHPVLRIKIT